MPPTWGSQDTQTWRARAHVRTVTASCTATEGGPLLWRNFTPAISGPRCPRPPPKQLRFHDLHPTCATLLIANGRHTEERKISRALFDSGHVRSYGHLFSQVPQELADGLDETYPNAAAAGGADAQPLRH
jgi:hypothetical protein